MNQQELPRFRDIDRRGIDRYVASRVKAYGGISLRYERTGKAQFPERVCVLPGGKVFWVKSKNYGDKPSERQMIGIRALRHLGQTVFICDSRQAVDEIVVPYIQKMCEPK